MPNSSATRRIVRASGPSCSRTLRPTGRTSRARDVSGSATLRGHGFLGSALERLVHSGKGGKGAPLAGSRDQRDEPPAETLPLDEPRAVPGSGLQEEEVLDVEDAADAQMPHPSQALAR